MPELESIPFWVRFAALLVLMGSVAGGEWLVRRERATRWREYGFLLSAGLLGGAFAAGIDQVSFALSPDYFVIGKDLDPGEGLRLRVTGLGFQAGLVGGLIAGGVLLLANAPREGRPSLPFGALWREAPWPLAGGLLLAGPGALLGPDTDPLDYGQIMSALGEARQRAFLQAWGLHAGVYLGAVLGLAIAAFRVRRRRPAPAPVS